jgi:hypothetical protein
MKHMTQREQNATLHREITSFKQLNADWEMRNSRY